MSDVIRLESWYIGDLMHKALIGSEWYIWLVDVGQVINPKRLASCGSQLIVQHCKNNGMKFIPK